MDNTAEEMQEPIRQERELDRLYERGLLGTENRVVLRRYSAGTLFFSDWQHSMFNPDFRSCYGKNDDDPERLTATDRYLKVWHAITPAWRYFVRCVLIDGETVDDFMQRRPIYNLTAEEKAVLLLTLQDALDQIADAYEAMEKTK